MFNFFIKIYTWAIRGNFQAFGEFSVVKPFLNMTNGRYIAVGKNVDIGSFSWVSVSTEFGGYKCVSTNATRLKIGNNVDVGNNAFIVANNDIEIGDNVIMAPYVYISDHLHCFDNIYKELHKQPLTQGGFVKIEDNVFIGTKACVLPNTVIGRHSVIGAGAVVVKNVPPYSVAVGNPARVIKKYDFKKKKWIEI